MSELAPYNCGDNDYRPPPSPAGLYPHTLEAIFLTSSSASGGSHRLLFVTSNAASISSTPIPRRRIVPARLVNVLLRKPSGMVSLIIELLFERGFMASRKSNRNQLGASTIGASFLQRYLLPLA